MGRKSKTRYDVTSVVPSPDIIWYPHEAIIVTFRYLVLTMAAAGVVCGAAALIYAWQPAIAPIAPLSAASFDPALVRRGAELALLGDCRTCHTAADGATYAGSLAMPTPFGTIYSTNITPDPETGIGRWSEAAFARALRAGVDREGRHLYPAFPYDHFTLTSDADVKALYAFFMSRPPVKATAPPNGLPFPINMRLVLAGWKLMFLPQGRFVPDPARDEQWNQGKYLVEGLGHCGACHSPRNLMGAEERSRGLAGGEAEGWHAYALGAASRSPVPWDETALSDYLAHGFHPLHGVARGPMAPVVENLAAVPRGDADAMAHYLASLDERPLDDSAGVSPVAGSAKAQAAAPARPGSLPQSAGAQVATPKAANGTGAALYAAACASCHEGGRALPLGGIDLSLSTALRSQTPENLLNVVMQGLPAADGVTGPVMPGFADVLDDAQIADLAGFLRGRLAQQPIWTGLEVAIRDARTTRKLALRSATQNIQ
jgi:mono/diheme cytochrome c family protein